MYIISYTPEILSNVTSQCNVFSKGYSYGIISLARTGSSHDAYVSGEMWQHVANSGNTCTLKAAYGNISGSFVAPPRKPAHFRRLNACFRCVSPMAECVFPMAPLFGYRVVERGGATWYTYNICNICNTCIYIYIYIYSMYAYIKNNRSNTNSSLSI